MVLGLPMFYAARQRLEDVMTQRVCDIGMAEASQEMAELVEWLLRTCGRSPRLQQDAPNTRLISAVHQLLSMPSILTRGDALSAILRLPALWSHALLEYVNGEKTYQSSPKLSCTLLNAGSASVRVQVAEQRIPVVSHSNAQVSDNYHVRKIYNSLEPGNEIDLDARWAVHALWANGRYSAAVPLWATMGADQFKGRPLVEVAYRAEWYDLDVAPGPLYEKSQNVGEMKRIDSRAWQRAQVAQAVELAKAAKSEKRPSEVAMALEGIRPWWPVDGENQSVIERLSKAVV